MEDLDDFDLPKKSSKPPPSKKQKRSLNPENSKEIVADSKWIGSDLLKNLENNLKVETLTGFSADFKLLGGRCYILILTEADYIGNCKAYKVALARFYKNHKNSSPIVICLRSEASAPDFSLVQNFCVIELGLPVIPISDLKQVPQVISQVISTNSKVNPFKFGLPKEKNLNNFDKDLVKLVQTIPGLGDKKARTLLEKLPSLNQIAQAEQSQLSNIVGLASARAVRSYFHHE